jgi:hypothetical protein
MIIRPCNPIHLWEEGGYRAMKIFELLEDFLIDQDDSLKKLMTWFFNLVMLLEAIQ